MTKSKKAKAGCYISMLAYGIAVLMTGGALVISTNVLAQTTDDPAITEEVDAPVDITKSSEAVATVDEAAEPEFGRLNLRTSTVDGITVNNNRGRDDAAGIALGAFTLRPSINQSIGTERNNDGLKTTSRSFSQTGLKGSLTSDWSSHQLTVNGEGIFRKTFSGQPDDSPEYKLDALLRLDVTRDTTANIVAAISRARETASAANAIQNASLQADVAKYSTGVDVTHDFGKIRTTLGVGVSRSVFGNAVLENGKIISQADRDSTTATLRGRIGFELSPALTPFVEASYGQVLHDMRVDSFGYRRDARQYTARAGSELDLGEKLRGELSAGYSVERFDDPRLSDITALVIDGNATWSPQRGTDVNLGLTTAMEPSTTAGVSGAVNYTLRGEISQVLFSDLTARVNLSRTWRNYEDNTIVADQRVLATGAGLTWGLSRYLDLTADTAYEITRQSGAPQSDVFKASFGLALKR